MLITKKIIFKIKYFTLNFIGGIIFCFFSILNIFYKFRFGLIYSSRIGHLCHNVDSYLSSRKKDEIAIFGIQKQIANKLILDLWKKKNKIYFSKVGFFVYYFLSNFFPKHKMLIKWEELYPNYSSLILKKRNISVKKNNIIKIIDNFNPKKPFICFHNRDSEYVKVIGNDNNEHDFRDYKFEDYSSGINLLLNKKIQPVRIGRITKDKKKIKNLFYYDYSNKNSNDHNDLYLINNCKFLVSSSTGLSNIASILRKKTLFVNFIPFWLREMYQYSAGSLFIPKKLYNLKQKRYLKFFEIDDLKHDIHEKNFFKKRNLKVVNNSKIEIKLAIKEMLENYQRKNFKIYNSKLHDKFWLSFKDQRASKIIREKLNINVCNSFLIKNKELI